MYKIVELLKKIDMIKKVILLGGHIQALGLAREIYDLKIPVLLFIEDVFSVARYSKCVNQVVVYGSIDKLFDAINVYSDTDCMLFPTADNYINWIDDNRNRLENHFFLGLPSHENVARFAEKINTYSYAEEHNIPHPFTLHPNNMSEIVEISETIDYPIVVKPSIMYDFHELFGKKAFRCDSKEELIKKCCEISKKIPINSIILQEYLNGGAKTLYSYGTFAKDGEPKAWIIANRIRQNPMEFGNSTTFAFSCNVPEIERLAKKILKLTNYTGLAEIEFMYDRKSNQYKFLEINTRAWKWHSISHCFGFGFLAEWVRCINGIESTFSPIVGKKAWADRLTDFTIIIKETLKRKMNLWEAICSYKISKTYATWSIKDPLPCIMYILQSPILFIKRY